MRKRLVVAALALASTAGAQVPSVTGTVVITNKTPSTATVVDVASGRTLATLPTGHGPHDLGPMRLTIIPGDARQTLAQWPGPVDAWFLDGFSPAKNPELWEPALLAQVADRLVPGGTLATYTAAGHVRRALAAAGLEVERRPGYGRKRHMTVARKPL